MTGAAHPAVLEREADRSSSPGPRLRVLTPGAFRKSIYWDRLDADAKHVFDITTEVLPFRVNEYVLENLIDWDNLAGDPMYRLVFPQAGMLTKEKFSLIERAKYAGHDVLKRAITDVRLSLSPHPSGQSTLNIPNYEGNELQGIQHKYEETVLFFPSQGQTCHTYCSFCFRWPQFVGDSSLKFESRDAVALVSYLRAHPEVTDVLVTGGDPMVMNTRVLSGHILPILERTQVRTIRIGSKALSYWPYRFTTDPDASNLLALFRRIVASGRHLAFMAHFNHPRELDPPAVQEAIARIRETGAVIRTQGPLLRHINDDPVTWAELWSRTVALGCVPYYMFVERDTGASPYFRLPLVRAHAVFREAYARVSGLARSVRGPIMSATPGKVLIDGTVEIGGRRAFALQLLQARRPDAVRRPFLAAFDETATWFDDLVPFDGGSFPFDA